MVEVGDVAVEDGRDEGDSEGDDGAPLVLREPQDERKEASSLGRKSRKGIGGPKTAEGKAAVRLNAVRHGVLTEPPVLPMVESKERWEDLRREVLDSD
jgi:hypothetical protein